MLNGNCVWMTDSCGNIVSATAAGLLDKKIYIVTSKHANIVIYIYTIV